MIKGINLRLLRNAELLQFTDYIIKTVEHNNPKDLKLDERLLELKEIYNTVDSLFKLPQDSLLTAQLQKLDTERDHAIVGISKIIDAYLNHFDPTFVNAAKLLNRNLTMYGSHIYSMNYQAESITLTNIVKDWDTEESLREAVNQLNLGDWKNEMNSKNMQFIELYAQRTDEYSAESLDKIKQKRIELYEAYYSLRDLITSYATIDRKNPGYQLLMREFNTYIEQYNALLANRKGHKKEEE
ncbi:MAG: hypothetical protein EOO43_09145 [Flavobacterium sp.]|nr:MAG: hypothetical protein EOO43_09145 [Flavobacterium sp.]